MHGTVPPINMPQGAYGIELEFCRLEDERVELASRVIEYIFSK